MTKLVYGDGRIKTQQGNIENEGKCLTITAIPSAKPIGSTEKDFPPFVRQEDHDVVLVFKSLEAARTLQDEINELCAVWSREINPKV